MPENTEDGLLHPSLYFGYDQDTIYDRLDERGIPWRIYHGDIPQSLVLSHQRQARNATQYEMMGVFFSDAQSQEQHFPAYSFIEPCYYWPGQNDDHPPHTTVAAQALTVPTERPAVTAERMLAAESAEQMNPQQQALVTFSEYLEQEIQEPAGKPLRGAAMTAGVPFQVMTAKDRVVLFLSQQKARARLP